METKRIDTRQQAKRAFDVIVAKVGGDVAMAATNLSTGETLERDVNRPMPTAGVFKLSLLVEVFRQANADSADLHERVTLRAEDVVRGSDVLRDFGPGLQPTLRNLVMIIIASDNSATDLLLNRVGGP